MPAILTPGAASTAAEYLRRYLDTLSSGAPRYSGSYFEKLARGDPNIFTAEDLLAVSMLSLDIGGQEILQLLGYVRPKQVATLTEELNGRDYSSVDAPINSDKVTTLLEALPADRDLHELSDAEATRILASADRLYEELRRKDFGEARVTKLLARKRPRLLPVVDSRIRDQLDPPVHFNQALHQVLRSENLALVDHLIRIRQAAGALAAHLSILRTFDIVLWMAAGAKSDTA